MPPGTVPSGTLAAGEEAGTAAAGRTAEPPGVSNRYAFCAGEGSESGSGRMGLRSKRLRRAEGGGPMKADESTDRSREIEGSGGVATAGGTQALSTGSMPVSAKDCPGATTDGGPGAGIG